MVDKHQEHDLRQNPYSFVKRHYGRLEGAILRVGPRFINVAQKRVKIKDPDKDSPKKPVFDKRKGATGLLLSGFFVALIIASFFEPFVLLFLVISVILLLTIKREEGQL